MAFVKPTVKSTTEMLSMLFGDGVEVAEHTGPDLSEAIIGTYLRDDDTLTGACVVDIYLAAYAGCAMSGLPAGAAQDAVKSGSLTDVMAANLGEVANICTRLLMDDSSDHLRFAELLKPDESADCVAALSALTSTGFTVSVPRYGAGALAFYFS